MTPQARVEQMYPGDRMRQLDALIAMGRGDIPQRRYRRSHAEVMRERAIALAKQRRGPVKAAETPQAVRDIVRRAAERHLVLVEWVTGPQRHAPVVAARREVAKELRRRGLSLPLIGQYLGGKHSSSILGLLKPRKRRVVQKSVEKEGNHVTDRKAAQTANSADARAVAGMSEQNEARLG